MTSSNFPPKSSDVINRQNFREVPGEVKRPAVVPAILVSKGYQATNLNLRLYVLIISARLVNRLL
jgi:hypothetical protein